MAELRGREIRQCRGAERGKLAAAQGGKLGRAHPWISSELSASMPVADSDAIWAAVTIGPVSSTELEGCCGQALDLRAAQVLDREGVQLRRRKS